MDIHSSDNAAGSQSEQVLDGALNVQTLSKNAQRRAAKAARLHKLKLERRAREKEARKQKRRERAKAIENGKLNEDYSRKGRTNAGSEADLFNARVVVDLGFDDLMSDKEINSLTSQLAYTYSANRHAARAFSVLMFTSLSGRTKQRLEATNDASFRRWSRTEWREEGYEQLLTNPQSPGTEMNVQSCPELVLFDRKNIVYLTADSSEELVELNEGETYIIGGICDHNRYKNLCLNKAIGSQIRHARLPISRYISLATRKVLTVNQVRVLLHDYHAPYCLLVPDIRDEDDVTVPSLLTLRLMRRCSFKQVFEILLKWIDSRNWEEAFWTVIPRRKLQDRGGGGKCELVVIEQDSDHGGSGDSEATCAK